MAKQKYDFEKYMLQIGFVEDIQSIIYISYIPLGNNFTAMPINPGTVTKTNSRKTETYVLIILNFAHTKIQVFSY